MSMKEFYEITPFPWYTDLITFVVAFAYLIYVFAKIWRFFDEAHYYNNGKDRVSIKRGLNKAFFDRQMYFTLYDIFRLAFIIPPIIAGVFLLLLKEGAWNLFPFLRKVLGLKLFRIEKEDQK